MVTDKQFDDVVNNIARTLADLDIRLRNLETQLNSIKGDINMVKSKQSIDITGEK